jgi:hypothetical protein
MNHSRFTLPGILIVPLLIRALTQMDPLDFNRCAGGSEVPFRFGEWCNMTEATTFLQSVNTTHELSGSGLPREAMAALLLEVHASLLEDPGLQHLCSEIETVLFELMSGRQPAPADASRPCSGLNLVK